MPKARSYCLTFSYLRARTRPHGPRPPPSEKGHQLPKHQIIKAKEGNPSGFPSFALIECAFVPDYRTFLNDFAKIIDFLDWYADKK